MNLILAMCVAIAAVFALGWLYELWLDALAHIEYHKWDQEPHP